MTEKIVLMNSVMEPKNYAFLKIPMLNLGTRAFRFMQISKLSLLSPSHSYYVLLLYEK